MKRTILVAMAILTIAAVASADSGKSYCEKLKLKIGGTINEAELVLANGHSLDEVAKHRTTSFITKSGIGNESLISYEYKNDEENITVNIDLDAKNLVSEYSCAATYERITNKSGSEVSE